MDALREAAGHIRSAARELLESTDPTGESLRLGLQGLDLVEAFAEIDVDPAFVTLGMGPAESLTAASDLLMSVQQQVPLALVGMLKQLRDRVNR